MDLQKFCRGIHLMPEAVEILEKMEKLIPETEYQQVRESFLTDHEEMFREVLKTSGYRQRFLYYYCRFACDTYEKYREKGIGDQVFFDTFSDISLWCSVCFRRYGEYGIQEYGWLWRHVKMTLFRLGRLQFERMESQWEFIHKGITVKKGDPVISIHIPEGSPLIPEECLRSLKIAQVFWKRKMPYICHSWLLYPGLKTLLGENSNILKFQELFDLVSTDYQYREGEERIFGILLDSPSGYPENTSLQRRAKKHLKEGGRLGSGLGVVTKT